MKMENTNEWCEFCDEERKSVVITYFGKKHHVCDECANSVLEQKEDYAC